MRAFWLVTVPLWLKTASSRDVFWCLSPRLGEFVIPSLLGGSRTLDDRQGPVGGVFLKSRLARGLGGGDRPAGYFNHPDLFCSNAMSRNQREGEHMKTPQLVQRHGSDASVLRSYICRW